MSNMSFMSANNVDPDEIPRLVVFYLGQHYLFMFHFNQYMPNGISQPNQLGQSISILRVVGC